MWLVVLAWIKDWPYIIEGTERVYIAHPNAKLPKDGQVFPQKGPSCQKDLYPYFGVKRGTDVWSMTKGKGIEVYVNGKPQGSVRSLPEFWSLFGFPVFDEFVIPELKSKFWGKNWGIEKGLIIDFNSKDFLSFGYAWTKAMGIPKKGKVISSKEGGPSLRGGVEEYLEFLTPDFPRERWNPQAEKTLQNIHMGQDKLLFSEIEYLLSLGAPKEKILIIYPGGGPGTHLPLLAALTGSIIIAVDPAFKKQSLNPISPEPGVYIVPTLFEVTNFIDVWSPGKIILISDIRSAPERGKTTAKEYQQIFDKNIKQNMKMQKEWLDELNKGRKIPITGLFKFRLTWESGKTWYTGGRLAFQVFAKTTSTELRLWADSTEPDALHDHRKVEEQMFFFNSKYRPGKFYDIDPFFGRNYDLLKASKILGELCEKIYGSDGGDYMRYVRVSSMFAYIDHFFKNHRVKYYKKILYEER